MKIQTFTQLLSLNYLTGKTVMVLRLGILIFLSSISRLYADESYAQRARINLDVNNTPIKEVLSEIQLQSEFYFLFNSKIVDVERKVDIHVKNEVVSQVLSILFKDTDITYTIVDRQIVLSSPEKADGQQLPTKKLTGKVTDEKGSPIPGATVFVKGTTLGVTTDVKGEFMISVPDTTRTLVVSCIGMVSKTIEIGNKNLFVIVLETASINLDEVIVIGYGTQKKKDLTGSYSTVSSKDMQKIPLTNVEGLIANKLPGVQMTPFSGKPGAGSSILIRGGASLNASNDPLIVIDGVAVEGWNSGPGMLSQLNPNDIESFTVLKDASASAIYGSRASNGVIIITTKKGGQGKMKIDFSSNFRVSTLIKDIPALSADQYRTLAGEIGNDMITAPGDANTNWQKEIFQTALASDNNLSVSGTFKSIPYRASAGYLNQNGIVKTGKYERVTALLNLSPSYFNNHLKLNLNLKGSSEKQRLANETAIWGSTAFDPTQPVHVDDQTYGGYFQYTQFASNPALAIINPLSMLEQVDSRSAYLRSVGNIQADYSLHFLPALHVNVNAGYDISKGKYTYYTPATYFPDNIVGGYNNSGDPSSEVKNTMFESYLFYNKELQAIKSKFDFTAGYSYNNFLTTNYSYPSYTADGTKIPNSDPTFAYDKPSHAIISFYGRFNYVLNQKYLLTATLRDDASSRFSEKYRWGLFPSVALAWKIKEENFLKNNKVISDLKLRFGYGITGQQDGIANYLHIPGYTVSGLNYQYGVGSNDYSTVWPSVYNPDLKWEQTATTNIGLDFGFLNNRISGSIDSYYKKTKDLLNNTTIPLGVNFASSMLLNIGSMENMGLELALKGIPIQNDNLQWDVNFSFTYNLNKITHLNNASDDGVGLFSNATLVNTVGYSRNTFYLYHQVYDVNGKPIEDQMLDVNKDGLTNASDRYITSKSALPKYIMGFSTNLQYKKWNAGASFHSNIGHYLFYKPYDNTISMTGWQESQNLTTMYYESLFSHSNQYESYSDYYLQDASFLKMDNFNVGYNFGKLFAGSSAVLRITASVQNVFTITNYTGQDPETNSGYQVSYPVPRVFALGLNLNF
jgi:TonB-dependent starch-binding outer membrane protein SusC